MKKTVYKRRSGYNVEGIRRWRHEGIEEREEGEKKKGRSGLIHTHIHIYIHTVCKRDEGGLQEARRLPILPDTIPLRNYCGLHYYLLSQHHSL